MLSVAITMTCNSRVAKAISLSQPRLHVKEKEKEKRQEVGRRWKESEIIPTEHGMLRQHQIVNMPRTGGGIKLRSFQSPGLSSGKHS